MEYNRADTFFGSLANIMRESIDNLKSIVLESDDDQEPTELFDPDTEIVWLTVPVVRKRRINPDNQEEPGRVKRRRIMLEVIGPHGFKSKVLY